MIRTIIIFLVLVTTVACGDKSNDIYKTKTGAFASQSGNFMANFPSKPSYTSIDNQIGLDKFQIHLFRSSLGKQSIFSIEFTDYPEFMIKSLTDEQLYDQGVSNFSNKVEASFDLHFQEPIVQHGLNGRAFQLEPNATVKNRGLDGFIMGRIFRQENRVYTVTYMGLDNKHVGTFLDSFKLL